jgi:squalene-hopene/tetraprenyl-beta-curcumene cyclase
MKRLSVVLCALFIAAGVFAGEADVNAVTAAAKKAGDFLLKQQNENGTFGKSQGAAMPGMVGLVVKALASSPDKLREDNPALAKAVKYLLAQQQPNGAIAIPQFGLENYNTSVAAIALVAVENPAYKQALEKAKQYILSCQLTEQNGYNKEEHTSAFGGFGYGSSKRADMSNTGFSLEALKAMGLEENSPAWKNAVLFIKRSQDNDETNDVAAMKGGENGGGVVYLPGDSEQGTITTRSGKKLPKPYGNMTYQAVKSLIYANAKADPTAAAALDAAFKWIKNNYAVDHQPGGAGTQGYYYYVNVFAKAFAAAGIKELTLTDGRKVNWASDLANQLVSLQKPDGSFVNEDKDKKWMEFDPVLCTSYALDALNLCLAGLKK